MQSTSISSGSELFGQLANMQFDSQVSSVPTLLQDKWRKQNTSIRLIAKSKIWFPPKSEECTGELNIIRRRGRTKNASKVDDHRVPSLVKKNPFTTSRPVRNTLEKVGVSLSSPRSRGALMNVNTGANLG